MSNPYNFFVMYCNFFLSFPFLPCMTLHFPIYPTLHHLPCAFLHFHIFSTLSFTSLFRLHFPIFHTFPYLAYLSYACRPPYNLTHFTKRPHTSIFSLSFPFTSLHLFSLHYFPMLFLHSRTLPYFQCFFPRHPYHPLHFLIFLYSAFHFPSFLYPLLLSFTVPYFQHPYPTRSCTPLHFTNLPCTLAYASLHSSNLIQFLYTPTLPCTPLLILHTSTHPSTPLFILHTLALSDPIHLYTATRCRVNSYYSS